MIEYIIIILGGGELGFERRELPGERRITRIQSGNSGCFRWHWATTSHVDEDESTGFSSSSLWCGQHSWCYCWYQSHGHLCRCKQLLLPSSSSSSSSSSFLIFCILTYGWFWFWTTFNCFVLYFDTHLVCHVIVVGVTSNFLFDNSIVGEGDLNLERLRWKQQDALVELQGFW